MKKRVFAVLLAAAMAISPAAALAGEEADAVQAETEMTSSEGQVKSYLTGLDVPEEIGRQRPLAIMLSNIVNAVPQSGISKAGVIYEAPVEGDITRLMALFEDYEGLERIGSVRSCRDCYIFYANEFDAIYCHYGQSAFAVPFFEQHLIDNVNGLTMGGTAYFRTSDRQAPHNAYTNAEYINNGIQTLGYRRELKEDYQGHYRFAPEGSETTLDNGITANIVKLDNFKHNHPWFEYDAETKKYKRFQFDGPQIDELTGEQLTCDNIILQYSSCPRYEGTSYLNIDVMSGGQGKYITRGKAVDIRWEKDSPWGITHYIDENEDEIQLNPGTTWVEIVHNDRLDAVTYQ